MTSGTCGKLHVGIHVPQGSPFVRILHESEIQAKHSLVAKSKVLVFSGSHLLTCMLPTFCPPTIWAISQEFCRKPSMLEADDFLGA